MISWPKCELLMGDKDRPRTDDEVLECLFIAAHNKADLFAAVFQVNRVAFERYLFAFATWSIADYVHSSVVSGFFGNAAKSGGGLSRLLLQHSKTAR